MSQESQADASPPITPKPSDAYHHGDLRAALLLATREALETMAPEAVTLKSLALRIGVSQPAPYRHFQNREALLAAVAADGFERFRLALVEAAADGPAADAFQRSCLAYIAFGLANMGVYRLMFASGALHTTQDQALDKASEAAFAFLLAGVAALAPRADPRTMAIWVWSSLHGMVMLSAEGMLSGPLEEQVAPAQIVRQMIEALRR